jgi:hypothetical protein
MQGESVELPSAERAAVVAMAVAELERAAAQGGEGQGGHVLSGLPMSWEMP